MDVDTFIKVGGFVLSLLVFAAGLMWRVSSMINALHARVNATRDQLNDFKIEVAREYVSVQHLGEVEGRIGKSLDDMREELKSYSKQVLDALSRAQERK